MKILKEGKVRDIWIGKCVICDTVMESVSEELKDTSDAEFKHGACMVCNNEHVIFNLVDTQRSKVILRKIGMKDSYFPKDKKDIGIYPIGTK